MQNGLRNNIRFPEKFVDRHQRIKITSVKITHQPTNLARNLFIMERYNTNLLPDYYTKYGRHIDHHFNGMWSF